MAKSDALQRQLDNDEPKCSNCREWDVDKRVSSVGVSGLMIMAASAQELLDPVVNAAVLAGAVRTDLAVCSKWEAK